MGFSDNTENGFAVLSGQLPSHLRPGETKVGGTSTGAYPRNRASLIGFTAPTVTYDKIRTLQTKVIPLDADVRKNVPTTAPFYAAWSLWFDDFERFYTLYGPVDAPGHAQGVFISDELAAKTSAYWRDYQQLYDTYSAQKTAQGKPVPPPSIPKGSEPTVPPDNKGGGGGGGWSLPWWFWVGGTLVLGTALYVGYRYLKMQAGLAGRLVGGGGAASDVPRGVASRDGYILREPPPPVHDSGDPFAPKTGRDPMFSLAAHASQPVVYRPYEHPHVVATHGGYPTGGPAPHALHVARQISHDPQLRATYAEATPMRHPPPRAAYGGYRRDPEPGWGGGSEDGYDDLEED